VYVRGAIFVSKLHSVIRLLSATERMETKKTYEKVILYITTIGFNVINNDRL